jgi:hypothetical protein
MEPEVRIRAFRATDDSETCLRFILGHQKVLENHGIYNVTSSAVEWMYNSSVFVIVVESLDGTKLYGGARVHAADGKSPLPIETATGEMDPRIYEYVKFYSQFGACELGGLWNSKEVAGLGIGSFLPSIAAVAITQPLGINILFALCSPLTTRFKDWIGGIIFTSVGNNGTFYYPKIDLLATVLFSDGLADLPLTAPRVKEKMIHLRQNPICVIKEKSPFKNQYVNVHYDLAIKSIDINEFKIKS